ncbi:MAG: FKBP-type peptidyl-prolyl cis-trans isomerase [Gemmatimonadaceae bacterium]|nr:FKBP-type peptidyl-prolyl cis-trans isomerase [Chitinophagaceae bacterium]
MRKITLFLFCAIVIVAAPSCLKNKELESCTNVSAATDEPTILSYLTSNNITGYVKHSSGLYYKVITPGAGAIPGSGDKVYVKYKGYFTNKTSFDSETDATKTGWVLNTLIPGWIIGLPMISKGGKIELYVPSSLGYGCQPTGPIPANSVLVFEIELVDIG